MSRRDEEEAAISEVMIGTPLDPLNEDNMPSKKPKQLEDQIVTDEQGRRRFHGAFTGGFSAGYYNTVGTKEGWTPSSFKSSRSNKMEQKTQSIRDFLDDEDIGQFGFAPETMRARDTFEKQCDNVKRKKTFQGPLLSGSSILDSVLKPSKETFGVHILMKMGWKPGQGIGPRLNYAEKRKKIKVQKNESTKVYGCALPPGFGDDDGGSDGESEKYEDITFAPDDIPVCLMKPKENLFGLGYKGLDRHSVLSSEKSSAPLKLYTKHNKESKIGISGQAFGVGAYEEEDEDIYSTEDLSQYDVVLGGQGDSQKKAISEKKPDLLKPITKIVDGFVQGSNATLCRTVFRPLSVPKGFVPMHKPPPLIQTPVPAQNSGHKGGIHSRHSKSATDRKKILDDPIEPQVVAANQPVNLPIINIPTFSKDRHKQERYELFVSLFKQGKKDEFASHQPETLTDWEKDREQLEFEKSMEFFKPMSSGIASRFVSAGIVHDGLEQADQLSLAMQKPDVKTPRQEAAEKKQYGKLTRDKVEWHPDKLLCKRFNIANPYPGSEIVGTLRPVRVDPMLDFLKQYKPVVINKSNTPVVEESSQKAPKIEAAKSQEHLRSPLPLASNTTTVNNSGPKKVSLQTVNSTISTATVTPPLTSAIEPPTQVEEKLQNRPPVDFFKAIFEDSDDDDELPSTSSGTPSAENVNPTTSDTSISEKNKTLTPERVIEDEAWDLKKVKTEKVSKSGSKRKHGVFSDIDFDTLNKPIEPIAKKQIVVQSSHESSNKDNSAYGPAIPPNLTSVSKPSNGDSAKKHKKAKDKKTKHKKSKHKKKSRKSSDEGYLEISLDKKLKTLIKKLI